MSIEAKLNEANVPFTKQCTKSNGFNGTMYVFATKKIARAAHTATGYEPARFFKQWSITIY